MILQNSIKIPRALALGILLIIVMIYSASLSKTLSEKCTF